MYKDIQLILKNKGVIETVYQSIKYLANLLLSKAQIFFLRLRGYKIAYSATLAKNVYFFQSRKNSIKIGANCKIGRNVAIKTGFDGTVIIGDNVAINDYTIIDSQGRLEIGNNTLISPFCYICNYDHVFSDKKILIREQGYNSKPIIIGKNVWLGTKTVVLKGVKIGDNGVIGAGSVVTKDISSNSVAVGNPAKVIRER